MAELRTTGDDTRSGITTDPAPDHEPPGFRVTWIAWDSDFRRELQLGDVIVSVAGRPAAGDLTGGRTDRGIGQWNEATGFSESGVKAGQVLALGVVRAQAPQTVPGAVHGSYHYFDAQGSPALAPGGPSQMASDGFNDAWTMWYDTYIGRSRPT